MTPSQKSRWEKRAREYARASDTPATSHYAYLQGVSDCFAEMAAIKKDARDVLDLFDLTYGETYPALLRLDELLKEDDQ